MSLTIEELRKLSTQIAADPSVVDELSAEHVTEMRKYLNPLGNIIASNKVYANMSIVNWREKYLRRLHTTALIGYTYRVLEEYEPEEELAQETRRFDRLLAAALNDEERARVAQEHEARVALIKTTARNIVRRFLNRNFEFNPDKHLRGCHSENAADPERKPKEQAIREACSNAERANAIDDKLESRQDMTYGYVRSMLLSTYQSALEATDTLKSVLGLLLDPQMDVQDKQGILYKKYGHLASMTEDMRKLAEPLAAADTLSAWNVNPPADVFHQFDRYLTNHYEQLRDVVHALYNEKSDFEYAVIFHNVSKTAEAAREYRLQHENEFRAEVFAIENSGVTLIGPFKENRERVDFYNKNTEIMKRMMDQMDSDHKLGKDLMEKQVKSQKKKNINEAGPDAPGLAAYSKTMNVVQELGAKKGLSKEEAAQFAGAKEDYEVPDDAIQIDMFFPQTNLDGTTELKKQKFYSQAEAPLHMQQNGCPDQYQPKRGDSESLDQAYRTKTIISKTGEKMELKVSADPHGKKKDKSYKQ